MTERNKGGRKACQNLLTARRLRSAAEAKDEMANKARTVDLLKIIVVWESEIGEWRIVICEPNIYLHMKRRDEELDRCKTSSSQ